MVRLFKPLDAATLLLRGLSVGSRSLCFITNGASILIFNVFTPIGVIVTNLVSTNIIFLYINLMQEKYIK